MRIAEIEIQIAELYAEREAIRKACPHEGLTGKYGSSHEKDAWNFQVRYHHIADNWLKG